MSKVALAEADNADDHLSRGRCDAAIRAIQRASFALGRAEPSVGLSNKTYDAKQRVSAVTGKIAAACRLR